MDKKLRYSVVSILLEEPSRCYESEKGGETYPVRAGAVWAGFKSARRQSSSSRRPSTYFDTAADTIITFEEWKRDCG